MQRASVDPPGLNTNSAPSLEEAIRLHDETREDFNGHYTVALDAVSGLSQLLKEAGLADSRAAVVCRETRGKLERAQKPLVQRWKERKVRAGKRNSCR